MRKSSTLISTSSFLTKQDLFLNLHDEPYVYFHNHTFFEFHIQIQGSVIHHYDEKVEQIQTGDILLISPALSHNYTADSTSKKSPRYLNLAISASYFKNLITCLGITHLKTFIDDMELLMKFHIPTAPLRQLCKRYNELAMEENKQSPEYLLSLKFYLISLLDMIHSIPSYSFSEKPRWLVDFLNILNDPIYYPLSIQELAQHSFYSPNHLSVLFKKHMGVTIHEYVRAKKMDHAAYLLKNTNFNITEIAIQLGYSEQGHFSSLFKRIYKCSPVEYRTKHSIKNN